MSTTPLILIMVLLTISNLFSAITQYNKERYKSAMFSSFAAGVTSTTALAILVYL